MKDSHLLYPLSNDPEQKTIGGFDPKNPKPGIYDGTTVVTRFESKVELISESGCWIFMGCTDKYGYGCLQIRGNKYRRAHIVSWEIYRGSIPKGMCVCHHCDTPPCANPYHLFLGTKKDNAIDSAKKNRHAHVAGSQNPRAVLSQLQVDAIIKDDRICRIIAQDYGVSRANISHIKNGRIWRTA